jgi:hypothetical protein
MLRKSRDESITLQERECFLCGLRQGRVHACLFRCHACLFHRVSVIGVEQHFRTSPAER